MPNWTPQQQKTLFTLAMLPNLGGCHSGSGFFPERDLLAEINAALVRLRSEIGTWDVAWGPAIAEIPFAQVPDNVMIMFERQGGDAALPDFVVGIAGTNPRSLVDWVLEDALVAEQRPWNPDLQSDDRKISLAIRNGLTVLQDLKPHLNIPGLNVPLNRYLAVRQSHLNALHIGGHSLGGALSATLALWLHDTRAQWNPAGRASLSALAVAGPTAGNRAFAAYSDAQIGSQVTRLYNPLDIVPLHWATADLRSIADLYRPLIVPDSHVQDFVNLRIALSQAGGYTQIGTGQGLPNPGPNSHLQPQPTVMANFLKQVGYQHVQAYFDLLDLQGRSWIMECAPATSRAEP